MRLVLLQMDFLLEYSIRVCNISFLFFVNFVKLLIFYVLFSSHLLIDLGPLN